MDNDKKLVSFGFTKKQEKQSAINNLKEKEEHETDYVLELDGKEVRSAKPKEEPKELVIPLIQKNKWQKSAKELRKHYPHKKNPKEVQESVKGAEQSPKSIDDEAVRELIKEAAIHNDKWEQRGNTDLNMSIPILMRNRVPEGYEEEDKLDVALRPEETTGEDYDNVPIEQFGIAMLRGMGWKKEEGIGDKMKKTVEPIEVTVRPKGQGLGADKRPVMPKKQVKRKPGDKKIEEEPVGIAKGSGVLVTSGPHRNLYGKIEGTDEDNARVVIKLAISNESVTLSQYAVQLVDKEEYRKHAKDLGKFSKGHKELEKQEKKEESKRRHDRKKENSIDYDSSSDQDRKRYKEDRTHKKRHSDHDSEDRSDSERYSSRKHREDGHSDGYRDKESRLQDNDSGYRSKEKKTEREDRDRRRNKYNDEDRDRRRNTDKYSDEDRRRDKDRRKERDEEKRDKERYEKKEKRRTVEDDIREKQSPPSDSTNSKPQCYWLRPDLRVRFINKEYKKGRHYNSKISIIDVVTRDTCTCRTEEGRLLEDVKQDMLETLIPKTDPGYVMVVNGQLKGQLGTILKRDKAQCKAAVQLLQDRDQIVKLDYNDICEYVGDIQANDDY